MLKVLKVGEGQAFSEFRRIVIQDGSSFAVKDRLRDVFPGRFKRVSPVAVELHVSMDLLNEALEHITLTPDTFGERAELPEPQRLSGCLLLADRGYFSLPHAGEDEYQSVGCQRLWVAREAPTPVVTRGRRVGGVP